MSSLLSTIETLTGGANYVKWASEMQSYLEANGLWIAMEFAPSDAASVTRELDVANLLPGVGITLSNVERGIQTSDPDASSGSTSASPSAATTPAPPQATKPTDFDAANLKARGSIKFAVSADIRALINNFKYARDMWLAIALKYQPKGSTNAFGHFRSALDVQIPASAHPSKALDKFDLCFQRLADLGVAVPEFIKVMVLVTKFPSYADTAVQLLTKDDVNDMTLHEAKEELLHAWTLKFGAGKRSSNGNGEANKLTAVKRNQGGKSFNQQQGGQQQQQRGKNRQQQQQQASGSGSGNGNNDNKDKDDKKRRRGPRKSAKKNAGAATEQSNGLDGFLSDVAVRHRDPPLPPTKVLTTPNPGYTFKSFNAPAPRALSNTYPTLTKAAEVARHLGVPATAERLRYIEDAISGGSASKGSLASRIEEVDEDEDEIPDADEDELEDTRAAKRFKGKSLADRIERRSVSPSESLDAGPSYNPEDCVMDDPIDGMSFGEDVDAEIAKVAGIGEDDHSFC